METTNFNEEQVLRQTAEEKAREYFYNQKEHTAHYKVTGYMFGECAWDNSILVDFTDEEVARMKRLIIETVNDSHVTAQPITTIKEAMDALTLVEIIQMNKELKTIIDNRLEFALAYINEIDFDTKYYYYDFSVLVCDYYGKQEVSRYDYRECLTDEEYLTLLTLQLQYRRSFTFNMLIEEEPQLAAKLSRGWRHGFQSFTLPEDMTFVILFDEVRKDAEIIDGPLPANTFNQE